MAAIGMQALTVSTASVALTMPDGATVALITCRTADVYFQDDGTAATTGAGKDLENHTLSAGERLLYGNHANENPGSLRFIRTGSTDATLVVSYY